MPVSDLLKWEEMPRRRPDPAERDIGSGGRAPEDLSVSPVSPAIRQALITLVQRLAATQRGTALVLRETATSGYD